MELESLPKSWSDLSWQQLCRMWELKLRYGGTPDVARAAACLALLGLKVENSPSDISEMTGEAVYTLRDKDGGLWTATARELAHTAKTALPWFDFPYGDRGEEEQKDDKGHIIKERREPVRGYVSSMRDALTLPISTIRSSRHFALPQVACNNLTWQQYRALQTIVPQMFADDVTPEKTMDLQAQFLAHCLTPRSFALFDTSGGSIKFRPHYVYEYDSHRAEGLISWWRKRLKTGSRKSRHPAILFQICFQCYQTALSYYEHAYPLLWAGDSKSDTMRDVLQGEVGTINTVMKYAGYAEQQQVYDSNLPFILDILHTMTKEAKEVEKINSKIKKK